MSIDEFLENLEGVKAFGTELDVYSQGYGYISH